MSPPLASVLDLYREGIVDTGREAQFLFFVAFLLTFGFIRTSAHMIRAQVSWWPGNVSVGGTHIHHLVWGILLLLIFGWIGVAVAPDSPWREISAVMFGIGTGLTLDEFALWLNLKDVYWEKEGRRSIDAVIIAVAFTGVGDGRLPWLGRRRRRRRDRRLRGRRRDRGARASSSRSSTRRRRSSGWRSSAS